MTERSRFWDGTAVGDALAVTHTHLHDQFFRSILDGTGNKGVVKGWRNELEVTGAASPVSIATGGAVIYGMFYDSDSATTLTIATPSSGLSRYDRIVIRRTWADQICRVGKVTGTAAIIPAVPSLTQTANVIWEIPLATVLVDDAGTLTITDTREFCTFTTAWTANIVTAGMFEEGAVTTDKRPDRARYDLKGSGQIRPDSGAACTRVAGASYDYWSFADAAFNRGWAMWGGDASIVGSSVDFYVWSVPNVNGAGAGAENCEWDYDIYYHTGAGTPSSSSATTTVDQQLRVNTTVYRDLLVAGITLGDGHFVAVRLSRDGAADSYNSAMRLLGIEMAFTADA